VCFVRFAEGAKKEWFATKSICQGGGEGVGGGGERVGGGGERVGGGGVLRSFCWRCKERVVRNFQMQSGVEYDLD